MLMESGSSIPFLVSSARKTRKKIREVMIYKKDMSIHLIFLFFIGSNFFKYNNLKEKTGVCSSGFSVFNIFFYYVNNVINK